jgi:hypothetical protein
VAAKTDIERLIDINERQIEMIRNLHQLLNHQQHPADGVQE